MGFARPSPTDANGSITPRGQRPGLAALLGARDENRPMDVVKTLCPSRYCGASYSVVEESPGGMRRCDMCGTEFFSCPNPDCGATYSVEEDLGDLSQCERCGTEFS